MPGIVVKQILQSLKSGATELANVPCPRVGAGQVLIRTRASLVSAGTERMLVESGDRAGARAYSLAPGVRQCYGANRWLFDAQDVKAPVKGDWVDRIEGVYTVFSLICIELLCRIIGDSKGLPVGW